MPPPPPPPPPSPSFLVSVSSFETSPPRPPPRPHFPLQPYPSTFTAANSVMHSAWTFTYFAEVQIVN